MNYFRNNQICKRIFIKTSILKYKTINFANRFSKIINEFNFAFRTYRLRAGNYTH